MTGSVKTVGNALLADIGGTHARFAVLGPDSGDAEPVVLQTAHYPDFRVALEAYRQHAKVTGTFAKAAVCVAGPVTEGVASLTNCDWDLTLPALREAIGGGDAVLVNDFTAVALSLPVLDARDLRKLGGSRPVSDAPRAVLGPGTGLGVSALIPDGRGAFVPISGEGGHVDLAATNPRELEVLARLLDRYGHVSAERVLSGPGLRTLHETLADMAGVRATVTPEPAEIAALAKAGESPIAVETVSLFTRWLGSVAGDLALILGARGGVYVGGGIVNRWGRAFDARLFRERFEAKGRFHGYLAQIPTWVITDPLPALKGLATLV